MSDRIEDLVEIQQLLARYAVTITQDDIDGLVAVFTPDGTYSAFGETYSLDRFPVLVDAAPKGLFMTATPVIDLDGDTATGTQPLCFIDHATHDMRIGYYKDTYVRTDDGWRLKTRAMTFIRRSGVHDSGRPHAIGGPARRRCRMNPEEESRSRPAPTHEGRPVPDGSSGVARRARSDAGAGSFARRPHAADGPGQPGTLRRRLDALRLAGRSGRARRPRDTARGRRRGGRGPPSRRAGSLFDARSADAHHDRLRAGRTRRGDGAALAAR